MKNLHKKKVNVLGRDISLLLIIGIALMGIGTAALVPYLSNQVTTDVNVDSPITLEISSDQSTWETSLDLGQHYGGDTVTYYINESFHNNALNDTTTYVVTNITDTEMGIDSCEEIEDVVVTGEEGSGGAYSLSEGHLSCKVVDGVIQIVMNSTGMVEGYRIYQIDTTFAVNAIGDYNATVQHLLANPTA